MQAELPLQSLFTFKMNPNKMIRQKEITLMSEVGAHHAGFGAMMFYLTRPKSSVIDFRFLTVQKGLVDEKQM
jgi:hypothetical protein